MEYLNSIIWLLVWPILIYATYAFAKLNIKQIEKLEKLEELAGVKKEDC
ncbi:MAG: hypothetical protein ACK5LP_02395 [Campylobacteraceae bacterium]